MVLHYKSLSGVTADIPNLYFSWNEAFVPFCWAEKSEIHFTSTASCIPCGEVSLSASVGVISVALRTWTSGGSGDMNSF